MTATDPRLEHVWMTAREVADYLRIGYVTVRRHLAARTMRSTQAVPGGRHLIRREWADEWAEQRPALPRPIPNGRRTA